MLPLKSISEWSARIGACMPARNLFAALRRLDSLGLDRLYAEPCDERGLGLAIMDRLRRCASLNQLKASEPSLHDNSSR